MADRFEIGVALRFQRQQIHDEAGAVLLHREQLARVDQHVGVGGAAVNALDTFVIGHRVAIRAEQCLARRVLDLPLVSLCVTLAEIHLSAVEAELADHAIAVQELVVRKFGRELRVRVDTEKHAIQFDRDLALDLQIADIAFSTDQTEDTRKSGMLRKMGHGICLSYYDNCYNRRGSTADLDVDETQEVRCAEQFFTPSGQRLSICQ